METSKVKSLTFRNGRRTFFFDVNVASNKKNYLRITESRFVEEGKDRIRNTVLLFGEDVADFCQKLKRNDWLFIKLIYQTHRCKFLVKRFANLLNLVCEGS